MKKAGDAIAAELAALRHQIESLTQRFDELMAATTRSSPPPAAADEIPWLVIAAAVAAVVKEPHRIVSLQLPGQPTVNLWSIEGRRAVFHSHRVR